MSISWKIEVKSDVPVIRRAVEFESSPHLLSARKIAMVDIEQLMPLKILLKLEPLKKLEILSPQMKPLLWVNRL